MSEVPDELPVSTLTISLSRFKSTTIDGVVVNDKSEGLLSKDLAALSVRILLDGLSVDMVIGKRERLSGNDRVFWAPCFFPR